MEATIQTSKTPGKNKSKMKVQRKNTSKRDGLTPPVTPSPIGEGVATRTQFVRGNQAENENKATGQKNKKKKLNQHGGGKAGKTQSTKPKKNSSRCGFKSCTENCRGEMFCVVHRKLNSVRAAISRAVKNKNWDKVGDLEAKKSALLDQVNETRPAVRSFPSSAPPSSTPPSTPPTATRQLSRSRMLSPSSSASPASPMKRARTPVTSATSDLEHDFTSFEVIKSHVRFFEHRFLSLRGLPSPMFGCAEKKNTDCPVKRYIHQPMLPSRQFTFSEEGEHNHGHAAKGTNRCLAIEEKAQYKAAAHTSNKPVEMQTRLYHLGLSDRQLQDAKRTVTF
jgi:hypothetical protein